MGVRAGWISSKLLMNKRMRRRWRFAGSTSTDPIVKGGEDQVDRGRIQARRRQRAICRLTRARIRRMGELGALMTTWGDRRAFRTACGTKSLARKQGPRETIWFGIERMLGSSTPRRLRPRASIRRPRLRTRFPSLHRRIAVGEPNEQGDRPSGPMGSSPTTSSVMGEKPQHADAMAGA